MAGSINRVQLLGYVGSDPKTTTTNDGKKVVKVSIATTETWKDSNGVRQDRTTWHSVVVFNEGLVGVVEKYFRKGSRVLLEGAMSYRKYIDSGGAERSVAEVVIGMKGEVTLLDARENGGETTKAPAVAQPDVDDEFPY